MKPKGSLAYQFSQSYVMSSFTRMKQYWVCLVVSLIMIACNNPRREMIELQEEVMAIHDSSMVKMDAIYRQIAQLRKLQEHPGRDPVNSDSILTEEILDAITKLRTADDGMLDWMANYKAPTENADVEESIQYLETERQRIKEVDRRINESLENGQAILDRENSN